MPARNRLHLLNKPPIRAKQCFRIGSPTTFWYFPVAESAVIESVWRKPCPWLERPPQQKKGTFEMENSSKRPRFNSRKEISVLIVVNFSNLSDFLLKILLTLTLIQIENNIYEDIIYYEYIDLHQRISFKTDKCSDCLWRNVMLIIRTEIIKFENSLVNINMTMPSSLVSLYR